MAASVKNIGSIGIPVCRFTKDISRITWHGYFLVGNSIEYLTGKQMVVTLKENIYMIFLE